MRKKPKILVIGTGGTIGAKSIEGIWESGKLTSDELLLTSKRIEDEFDITPVNIINLHSADIQPKDWILLSELIYEKMSSGKFDGIVVTHGTDTMHYSATAISFMVQNLSIPIVFTGSQIVPFEIGSDAQKNFYDALRVAESNIAEVVIVFNGKILRPSHTVKSSAADRDAFQSITSAKLGTVQFTLQFSQKTKVKSRIKPTLFKKLETNVELIKIHHGFNSKLLEKAIELGVKGIVIEGYGIGNFPTKEMSLIPVINKAIDAKIPVILTTECAMGIPWDELFFKEIGNRYNLSKVIFGYNIRSHTALIKLMWILSQTSDLKEIKKLFYKNIAGEITSFPKKI